MAAAELQIMHAYGEALAGTGKPLVAAGSIGGPGQGLGRPATEEDPALPSGDQYKGTLRGAQCRGNHRSRPRRARSAVIDRAASAHRRTAQLPASSRS